MGDAALALVHARIAAPQKGMVTDYSCDQSCTNGKIDIVERDQIIVTLLTASTNTDQGAMRTKSLGEAQRQTLLDRRWEMNCMVEREFTAATHLVVGSSGPLKY